MYKITISGTWCLLKATWYISNDLNSAYFLYYNVNRSCFGRPSCDLRQDRQLSGLRPTSCLASDPTLDFHTKIYSLSGLLILMMGHHNGDIKINICFCPIIEICKIEGSFTAGDKIR